MTFVLIEIAPHLVVVDEVRYPDRDHSYILEHLAHYFSLLDSLPAISVKVEPTGPVIISGHKYLKVARLLGRRGIRAVVDASSDQNDVESLLSRDDVKQLDWGTIDAAERSRPVVDQWHVFFFDRPLREEEKIQFNEQVAGYFSTLAHDLFPNDSHGPGIKELQHDDNQCLAEFLAQVPVGLETWYGQYMSRIKHFNQSCARIISFQGSKFYG